MRVRVRRWSSSIVLVRGYFKRRLRLWWLRRVRRQCHVCGAKLRPLMVESSWRFGTEPRVGYGCQGHVFYAKRVRAKSNVMRGEEAEYYDPPQEALP